jgi:hypothetical protein
MSFLQYSARRSSVSRIAGRLCRKPRGFCLSWLVQFQTPEDQLALRTDLHHLIAGPILPCSEEEGKRGTFQVNTKLRLGNSNQNVVHDFELTPIWLSGPVACLCGSGSPNLCRNSSCRFWQRLAVVSARLCQLQLLHLSWTGIGLPARKLRRRPFAVSRTELAVDTEYHSYCCNSGPSPVNNSGALHPGISCPKRASSDPSQYVRTVRTMCGVLDTYVRQLANSLIINGTFTNNCTIKFWNRALKTKKKRPECFASCAERILKGSYPFRKPLLCGRAARTLRGLR